MVKIWAVISAFFVAFALSAQSSVYESPNVSTVAPEVRDLAHEITAKANTDVGKVTSIYTWITGHIRYDTKAPKGARAYQSPTDVMESGKAICYGYAQLFRDMCVACGLESYVVTGYGFDGQLSTRLPREANHAWNSVLVGGEWKLVDATWGSGSNSEKYLFPSPIEFRKSHIPSFYGWQLMHCSDSRYFHPPICGLRDSLAQFLSSDVLQRSIIEAKADYFMNTSERNRLFIGQAYINLAIDLKEKADSIRASAAGDASSMSTYQYSLEVFEQGNSYLNALFDWQKEAWALAILNRANALYNTLDKKSYNVENMQFIVDGYRKAISLLKEIDSSFTAIAALGQSNDQLSVFEAELHNLRN